MHPAFATPLLLPSRPSSPHHLHPLPTPATLQSPNPPQPPSPTPTPKLTPSEKAALTSSTSTLLLHHATTLYLSNKNPKPTPAALLTSLTLLETTQRKFSITIDPYNLLGQWRLIFTGKTTGANIFTRGRYFPLRSHQTFIKSEDGDGDGDGDGGGFKGIFDNGVFFGGASVRFRGPFRWITEKNRLEFTFEELRIQLASWAPVCKFTGLDKDNGILSGTTKKSLPFFNFFYARNGLAMARGRGGGVALYRKVDPGKEI